MLIVTNIDILMIDYIFDVEQKCGGYNTSWHLPILGNAQKPQNVQKIVFVDFWSAFSTIKPHTHAKKLTELQVSMKHTLWFIDLLLRRPPACLGQLNSMAHRAHRYSAPPEKKLPWEVSAFMYSHSDHMSLFFPSLPFPPVGFTSVGSPSTKAVK